MSADVSAPSAHELLHLGNGRRELGDMAGAAEALADARRQWAEGTRPSTLEAEILTAEALLCRDQRRLRAALPLLDRAAGILIGDYHTEHVRDRHGTGVVLLHHAWCLHHLGRHKGALAFLDLAAIHLDPGRDVGLRLALQAGRTWCLLQLGQEGDLEDAAVAAVVATELARVLGDRTAELRLVPARVRIPAERMPAGRTLRSAARELQDMKLWRDAALVLLDLADHLLGEGRPRLDKLTAVTAEVLALTKHPDFGLEGTAASGALHAACRDGRLTREEVRRVASLFERQRRPSLDWWSSRGTVLEEAEER